MNIYINPPRSDWDQLLARPSMNNQELIERVKPILAEVKAKGDAAVNEFTARFDGVALDQLRVTESEFRAADALVEEELKAAILQAKENIHSFHAVQWEPVQEIETMPGITCWRKSLPIEKVGLYIPGGTAPLFSTVLMLGVPAQIAGCQEVVLCSPPNKEGNIHPAILYAAQAVGIQQVYKVGGAQAIAAMAYGTESIPQVYKIFGPGNTYVTAAKQLVSQEGVAIDMPAGPSEVMVVADETAPPSFVAADLLAQAEHGVDSQVMLVAQSESLAQAVQTEVERQVQLLPRKEIAQAALENSRILVTERTDDFVDIINAYAPEHLILSVENDLALGEKIHTAGSVFLGHYTPESVGDYASGTNHTLPTHGYARAYSGVSLDSFVKKITFQKLSKAGLENIRQTVEVMAAAEQLEAHKRAVSIRFES
ncbi:MAG: histidinol dehydrogenase [Bacteroidota bacterium]